MTLLESSRGQLRPPVPDGRSVEFVAVHRAQEWDDLVAGRGGLFFHRHDFLSTMGQTLGFSVDLRKVVMDGTVIGAVPILYTRRGPLTTVNWLPFPYVGPLVEPRHLERTMGALLRHTRRMGCMRSQFELTVTWPTAVPDFVSHEERTFVVPLEGRDDNDLLEGMSSRRRSAVRRAGRNGLRVRTASLPEVTRLMPRLSAVPFERQGLRPPYPAATYDLAWERFTGDPDVLLQAADIGGRTVAVQISFAGASTGLAWVVGRDQDAGGSDAYVAMMWRTMCWARDRGCREFDLVGAPTEGIANYKRGLGALERRYTVFHHEARARQVAKEVVARAARLRDREQPPDGVTSEQFG